MIEIEESLKEKLEKTSNMFQHAPHVNTKTKKHSQKENRRKGERRKVSRKAANIQKVREFISTAAASEVIQIQNLKLEVLSTLSLFQVNYLQRMYLLSTEAINLISEYVESFPRKENTNLEPDNAHIHSPKVMIATFQVKTFLSSVLSGRFLNEETFKV